MILPQAQRERDRVEFASGLFHLAAAGRTSRRGWAEAIAVARAVRVPMATDAIAESASIVAAARPCCTLLDCAAVFGRYRSRVPSWQFGLSLCLAK
jgi:dTDP-4-dehydrorhamnose reductase